MDESIPPPKNAPPDIAECREIVVGFQKPSTGRALWQIVNTFGGYALLWYLMYLSLAVSWWLIVPLAVLAGAFLVRVFIIFHDCGHGSFFKSRRVNDALDLIASVLTLTPYYYSRWEHAIHHASAGDLDKRGTGDVWTLTVQDYRKASRWKRFAYRLARNPVMLFVIAHLFMFIILQRTPSSNANPRERWSVHWMNLAIAVMASTLSRTFGPVHYLLTISNDATARIRCSAT